MTPLKSAVDFLLVLRPGRQLSEMTALNRHLSWSRSKWQPKGPLKHLRMHPERTCEATLRTAAVKEERKPESKREGCHLKTRKWGFRMPTARHRETGQTSRSICLSFCHGNSLNTLQTRKHNAGTTIAFFSIQMDVSETRFMEPFSVTRFEVWQVCFYLYDVCLLLWQHDAAFVSHSPLPRPPVVNKKNIFICS